MSHLFRNTTMYGTPTWRASRMCSRVCGIGPSAAEHHQDRAVHLRRARDHVLHVVGVARAVDVRVVAVRRLVLHVRRVDRDPARLLFRRRVDLVVRLRLAAELLRQHRRRSPPSASSCRGPRDRSCPRSRAAWSVRICLLPCRFSLKEQCSVRFKSTTLNRWHQHVDRDCEDRCHADCRLLAFA